MSSLSSIVRVSDLNRPLTQPDRDFLNDLRKSIWGKTCFVCKERIEGKASYILFRFENISARATCKLHDRCQERGAEKLGSQTDLCRFFLITLEAYRKIVPTHF